MQKLSLRKYASLIGVSHTAIAKAIEAGHISKGYDPADKKIIVDLANEEYGNSKKKAINESEQLKGNYGVSHLTEDDKNQIGEAISFTEAKRKKQIYDAEISRLQALREAGKVVDKDAVYKQLFAFGQTIRVSMLAIPDREIDKILAAKNRSQAHLILTNAIHGVLEWLTTPPDLAPTPR